MLEPNDTLDGMFDTMREEPAMSQEALAAIIDRLGEPSPRRSARRGWIAGAAAALLVGGALLLAPWSSDDETGLATRSGLQRGVAAAGTGPGRSDGAHLGSDPTNEPRVPVTLHRVHADRSPGDSSGRDASQALATPPGDHSGTVTRSVAAPTSVDLVGRSQIVRQVKSRSGKSPVEPSEDRRPRYTAAMLPHSRAKTSNEIVDSDISISLVRSLQSPDAIQLRQMELGGIGVHVGSDGVVECFSRGVHFTRSNMHPDSVVVVQSRLRLLPRKGVTERVYDAGIPAGVEPTILPELITDENGLGYLFEKYLSTHDRPESVQRFFDSVERRRLARPRNVDGLIAIRVRGASLAIDGGDDNDIILWYHPSPEFIGALPPCIREQILHELDSAATVRANRIGTSQAWLRNAMSPDLRARFDSALASNRRTLEPCTRALPGRPILDLWRSASGAIRASSVVPNPVRGTGRVTLDLASARTVTMTLHDLQGKELRRLAENVQLAAGVGSIGFSAGDITTGLYLIVATTVEGERVVLRAAFE